MSNVSVVDKQQQILEVIERLREATRGMTEPMSVTIGKEFGKDSYLILVSCLLSLRAKDTATLPVCRKLFSVAKTPQQLLSLERPSLEKILFSIGFYRQKAQTLYDVSQELLERFNGRVPSTIDELLSIKGVGRKTANLVLGEAFDVPAICVDIHVHRISNRLGLVQTKDPEATERELQKIIPKKYWVEWNRLLVTWGQNICLPTSPWCSRCILAPLCPRRGVTRSR